MSVWPFEHFEMTSFKNHLVSSVLNKNWSRWFLVTCYCPFIFVVMIVSHYMRIRVNFPLWCGDGCYIQQVPKIHTEDIVIWFTIFMLQDYEVKLQHMKHTLFGLNLAISQSTSCTESIHFRRRPQSFNCSWSPSNSSPNKYCSFKQLLLIRFPS